eukprot:114155_1
MGASDSIPQQIEGASDSIRTWVKDRNIALSKDALGKLKQNGFETIKDLEYCSVQDIEVLAKQKMHIKSSDRQKLNKVMQILTAADNHKNTFVSPQPNEVITLMGSPGYNEEEVDEDTHISREGVTLMGGQTQYILNLMKRKQIQTVQMMMRIYSLVIYINCLTFISISVETHHIAGTYLLVRQRTN